MGGNADRMFPAPAAELSFNNPVAQKNPIMGKLKQKMIEGCADQVPAEVREAVDAYLTAKGAVAKNRWKHV